VTLPEWLGGYAGKRVLVTGHTGFKGSWLTAWLSRLGAEVTGLALAPESERWMFAALGLERRCRHRVGDVRDLAAVRAALDQARPEVVFHLAAQPLVRRSYAQPVETLAVNVMGTAHLLESIRDAGRPCAVVVVTSDKCYENQEWPYGYRETDPMGGHDVYSMSKGATELLVSSFRRSFFPPERLSEHGVALATARAGNVVGGGDWADDRLIPDCVRALERGTAIPIRRPGSVRPWQHVLEPLSGYLMLGARLMGVGTKEPGAFAEAWNFGPRADEALPVRDVVEQLLSRWGSGTWEDQSDPSAPHEAGLLRLSIDKAVARLGWRPRWTLAETIARTADWYRAQLGGASADELLQLTHAQLDRYLKAS
jgi:CDP-glucose 4,6-dehydratase